MHKFAQNFGIQVLPMQEFTLGNRIKMTRRKESQDSFAVSVGISRGALSSYERDESQPSAETLQKICTKYGVLPEWLLMGTGPMTREEPVEPCHPLDKAILIGVIEILEEFLGTAEKKLSPSDKGELVYQLYQLMLEETDAKRQPIRIFRLLQGAVAAQH